MSFVKSSILRPLTRVTRFRYPAFNEHRIMPLRPLLTINNSIVESLKSNEVFEDVLPQFNVKGLLQVSFGGDNEVTLGNTLAVADTQKKPQFQFLANVDKDEVNALDEAEGSLFTLVLTDPDAPSRTDKKWSEYAHFITTGITLQRTEGESSSFVAELDLGSQGKEILEYMGPGPPKGTGKHRYVFILFKQAKGVEPKPPADRPNWGYGTPATGIFKYAKEYSLEPWAINFFYAENKS